MMEFGWMADYTLKRMDGQRVLITGGMGFLGGNVAHLLHGLGAELTLYDAMLEPYGGNPANVREIRGDVEVIRADVRDFDTLAKHMRDKDVIFHFAAQVSHGISMQQPHLDIGINCTGSMNLLEACRRHNDAAKIVFSGTRGQTGDALRLPVDETHPDNPPDINGIDKLAAEKYHLLYNKVYSMRTASLRMTNTYGPRHQMKHGQYGVLNFFIRKAMLGETMEVYGDGSQLRDYNYVDDACDAFVLAAQKSAADGQMFLLGSGEQTRFIDMVKAVISAVGSGEYKMIPFPKERRAIDVKRYAVDFGKIRRMLGWHPKTRLNEGVAKTVAFYRERLKEYL